MDADGMLLGYYVAVNESLLSDNLRRLGVSTMIMRSDIIPLSFLLDRVQDGSRCPCRAMAGLHGPMAMAMRSIEIEWKKKEIT